MLGEVLTYGIDGSFGSPEKSLELILVKETQNSTWVDITITVIVMHLLMEKKSLSLKFNNVNLQFCLGSISNGFRAIDSRGV